MNYLAHSLLAFEDPELLIGQFIADDIKGKQYERFPRRIMEGILLHRFVDHFTDTFPACLELRRSIRSELGLFSGVAIDIFFDHILAKDWEKYHSLGQPAFIRYVYQVLGSFATNMDTRRNQIFGIMEKHDWLGRYKSLEGIELTFRQMSSRIPNGSVLLRAPEILENQKENITSIFEIFFPQLISATKSKLDTFAA